MTASNETRAAGWFTDPLNQRQARWWDGTEWTQLTQPASSDTATLIGIQLPPAPPVPAGSPGASWYPDPDNPHFQRYWDGHSWTTHVAPAPPQYPVGTTVVINAAPPKSVAVALLLTFFFGPFGMLYSTISGAIVMLLVSFIGSILVSLVTFGFGLFVFWPVCWVVSMIWGCAAVSNTRPGQTIIQR